MDLLVPVLKAYAWGSQTAIAGIQGRPRPSETPEAELWMGAHPQGPSAVVRGEHTATLDQIIAADPEVELGEAVTARYGARLPFLLKILAADKALSIQAHPTRAQAEEGFAADNAAGHALDSAQRRYVDDWPKPEMVVAITRFEALAGFRSVADALAFVDTLDVAGLAPARDLLARGLSGGHTAGTDPRRDALAAILRTKPDGVPTLLADLSAACLRLADTPSEYAAAAAALARMATDHPGDLGMAAAVLLNYVVLEPGESLVMGAAGLHAYLRGTGVEVMASSDNVIRAGLTPKPINVGELLRIVDPSTPVPFVTPTVDPDHPGFEDFGDHFPEFRLGRLTAPADVLIPREGPMVLLAVGAGATVTSAGRHPSTLRVPAGGSAFVRSIDPPIRVSSAGTVFVASVGRDPASVAVDQADEQQA